jgi:hypothetical protein
MITIACTAEITGPSVDIDGYARDWAANRMSGITINVTGTQKPGYTFAPQSIPFTGLHTSCSMFLYAPLITPTSAEFGNSGGANSVNVNIDGGVPWVQQRLLDHHHFRLRRRGHRPSGLHGRLQWLRRAPHRHHNHR